MKLNPPAQTLDRITVINNELLQLTETIEILQTDWKSDLFFNRVISEIIVADVKAAIKLVNEKKNLIGDNDVIKLSVDVERNANHI